MRTRTAPSLSAVAIATLIFLLVGHVGVALGQAKKTDQAPKRGVLPLDPDYQAMMKTWKLGEVCELATSGEPRFRTSVRIEASMWQTMLAQRIMMKAGSEVLVGCVARLENRPEAQRLAVMLCTVGVEAEKGPVSLCTSRIARVSRDDKTFADSPELRELRASLLTLRMLKLEVIGRDKFSQVGDMTIQELKKRGWVD